MEAAAGGGGLGGRPLGGGPGGAGEGRGGADEKVKGGDQAREAGREEGEGGQEEAERSPWREHSSVRRAQYDLVVVDEVLQLDADQFERILQMREAADKIPALVFAGDFWQLPGVSNSQATDSPKWRSVFVVNLHEMWRCKDQKLRKKLELLRTAAPAPEQLADICRGRKAWTHAGDPALDEIEEVLRRHPDTTVVTCTRQKAAVVNQLVIQALFEKLRKPALGTLDLDWEANPNNYEEGSRKPHQSRSSKKSTPGCGST